MIKTCGSPCRARRLALATTVALLALAAPSAASAGDAVAGEVPVSPTTALSPRDQQIDLLAGSPDYLAYELVPVVAGLSGGSSTSSAAQLGATTYVTDAAGDSTPLDLPSVAEISIEGGFVAAIDGYGSSTVDWTDVADHTSGSATMPASARYVGATPTGWVYLLGAGVWEETPNGTSTYLGAPVSDSDNDPAAGGAVGPDGVMTWLKSGAVGYLAYADPTHPVTLQPGYELPQGQSLECSLDTSAAVCQVATSNDTTNFLYGERLSLTGGPAVTYSNRFEGQGLDDITTAWTSVDQDTTTLIPVNGDPSTVLPYSTELASAFGKVVLTNASDTEIETVSAASDTPTQLVAPTRSPALATSFAITAGRVVWTDDEANPAAPDTTSIDTVSRPVIDTDGSIQVGTSSVIGTSGAYRGVMASGATTAYAENPSSQEAVIGHVVTPRGSTTFRVTSPDDRAQLSGNRLLYDGNRLLDLRTQKTAKVLSTVALVSPITLWGNYLAYLTNAGTVWRENLSTGHAVKLGKPLPGKATHGYIAGTVYEFGGHVGWVISYDTKSGSTRFDEGVVNVSAPSTIESLPAHQLLWALSSDGLVTEDLTQDSTSDSTFSLLGYGKNATLTELVPEAPRATGVDVDSGVMTWLDDGDVVAAAPLPTAHVADAPVSLGDPIAPKTFAAPGSAGWAAYVPFSAALTSCTVVIRHGSKVVRSLACDPTDMGYGDAYAQWDGKDSLGAPVAAGDYGWTVRGANADGHVLASNGGSKPVTGLIAVGVPSHLTLSPASARVGRESALRLSGRLTVSGASGGSFPLRLLRKLKGQAAFHVIAHVASDAHGSFAVAVTSSRTAHYRAEFAGTAVDHGAVSRTVLVSVES